MKKPIIAGIVGIVAVAVFFVSSQFSGNSKTPTQSSSSQVTTSSTISKSVSSISSVATQSVTNSSVDQKMMGSMNSNVVASTSTNSNSVASSSDSNARVGQQKGNPAIPSTVNVYFAKLNSPQLNATYPVQRTTTRTDLEMFVLDELFAGPTPAEAATGLISPFSKVVSNNSCASKVTKQFELRIKAGNSTRVVVCGPLAISGVGDEARIKSTTEDSLKQFQAPTPIAVYFASTGKCLYGPAILNYCTY
jgi:cytoskeletal protein RodZ